MFASMYICSRLSGFGMQNGIDYHIEENHLIYEQRIQKLEHDKMDLQRRLRGTVYIWNANLSF